ncbi:MAG: dihydrolipoamide acyltransferase [Chloroflexi bacterium]|nr:MAG: dihydrolipoamide acyltransferase [Chloroflexota bacterium]RLC76757.1 MAG: dihydrolipoamide acyltransferase [Chloroflexota bacterium]
MADIGTYEERRFPEFRNPTLDTLDLGKKKHHIPLLLEVDVTKAREYMREFKARTGEGLSFTGWVMKCIGQAVNEHKHIQAMRKGRKSLILFDDVDISVVVERSVGHSDSSSETLPMPYVVRRANKKTVKEISDEIRTTQAESLGAGEVQLGARRNVHLTKAFTLMPRFVRNLLVWRRLTKDPFFAKKMMGTVVVTSVGNIGKSSGYGWAIPIGMHPVVFALGSIARKPGVVDEEITIREYLSMTVLFDHDVTDGAPVIRFIQRLNELLEHGYGLDK